MIFDFRNLHVCVFLELTAARSSRTNGLSQSAGDDTKYLCTYVHLRPKALEEKVNCVTLTMVMTRFNDICNHCSTKD